MIPVWKKLERYLFDKSVEIVETGINVILDWGLWTKAEKAYAREFYRSRNINCEIHFIDISNETWQERLQKRNRLVTAKKINAYYVDARLRKKVESVFESPTKEEIDVWIRRNRHDTRYKAPALPGTATIRFRRPVPDLQDEETMYAYNGAFDDAMVQDWLDRQIGRYQKYGFGAWALIHKESGDLIGQCGLTMQPWKDRELLEIGYLLRRDCWHMGFATEAALACQAYAFEVMGADAVYSIIRDNNLPSSVWRCGVGCSP